MLKELIELSNRYGSDPDFVLVGGGNSSLKRDNVLYVKASGIPMSEIDETGFVKMSIPALDDIWRKNYPMNTEEREAMALEDLMNSRLSGESKRPSVETLLHSFIPFKFVMHTHPVLVNALCCSNNGERIAAEIWGPEMLWIPVVNPGYYLAWFVRDRIRQHLAAGRDFPEYIFLQNHGVFTGGETAAEVDLRYEKLISELKNRVAEDYIPDIRQISSTFTDRMKSVVQRFYDSNDAGYLFLEADGNEIVESEAPASILSNALTPDHIVYMGGDPLWVSELTGRAPEEQLADSLASFERKYMKRPKIILLQNRGIICCGKNEKAAENAFLLLKDALRIVKLSDNFGGVRFMPDDKAAFIKNWEVENYRESLSS